MFSKSEQKIRHYDLGGPDSREIELLLFREEVLRKRSLMDYRYAKQIVTALVNCAQVHQDKGSGLHTIRNNFLGNRHFRKFDAAWARENGGIRFSPSEIDIPQLQNRLHKTIVGQDKAKETTIEFLKTAKRGLSRQRGPFCRLLFYGPSGVGKTEIAKIICHSVFDNGSAMCRIDCGELSEEHKVAQLLGAPAGYTGYTDTPILEDHLRRFSAGLLLLDEFEKAHSKIHSVFLRILDEGVAKTAAGHELDFSNYIIIATSNAGNKEIDVSKKNISAEEREELYQKALAQNFAPEILGRFQDRVLFDLLTTEQLNKIARQCLLNLWNNFVRVGQSQGIDVPNSTNIDRLSESIVSTCNPTLGARAVCNLADRAFNRAIGDWENTRSNNIDFLEQFNDR